MGSSSKALITSCSPPFCNTSRRSCSVSEKFHSRLKQCICNVICSLFNSFSRPLSASDSLSLDFPKCFLERDLKIKRNSRIPAIIVLVLNKILFISCVWERCAAVQAEYLFLFACRWPQLQDPLKALANGVNYSCLL